MISWLASLPRRSLAAVKAHPVVTGVFTAGALAWLAFGVIIGGAPFFAFLLVILGAATWGALTLLRRRRSGAKTEATGTRSRRDGLVIVGVVAGLGLLLFGIIQLVPYGRPQTYQKGTGEPAWATPRTRELMVNACFACHSNEVQYPWYSRIAPVSWTVQHHIDEGRSAVNYSNWATAPRKGDDSIEVIREGSMPPGYFTAFGMHPEAKLSDAEKAELIAGLEATPGFQGGGEREDRER